jgi:hypothetical protein
VINAALSGTESQPITLIAMVKRLKMVTVNDKMQRGYRCLAKICGSHPSSYYAH